MADQNSTVDALIEQLDKTLVNRIEKQAIWFEEHRHIPRISFRIVGLLVIVLSASVPVVSSIDIGTSQKWLIPLLSSLVLVATSTQTFFNWHSVWVQYYQTSLGLRQTLMQWELIKITARTQPFEVCIKTLSDGAAEVAQTFGLLMSKEAESFSSSVMRSASNLVMPLPDSVSRKMKEEKAHDTSYGEAAETKKAESEPSVPAGHADR